MATKINNKTTLYILRVAKKCVRNVLKKISGIFVEKLYYNINIIGNDNEIIEIDESKFGKRKYNKGHIVKNVWDFWLFERNNKKRVLLFHVDNRINLTLQFKIKNCVAHEVTIYDDCCKRYGNLSEHEFNHKTVNNSKCYKIQSLEYVPIP